MYNYGMGGYGVGYSSPMDTNPYAPGTQFNAFDSDPTRPGVQMPGSLNGVPHYSSGYDTNPYLSGNQGGGYGGYGGGYGGAYGGGYGRY